MNPKKKNSLISMISSIVLLLSSVFTVSTPISAAELQGSIDAPMMFDASHYAQLYHVSVQEAVRRFNLQRAIGELDGKLTNSEKENFGGLWIEHTPNFHVVALFTSRGNETIAPYIPGELLSIVEVRATETSLAELEAIQANTTNSILGVGIPVESEIDVYNNRIKVYVVDRTKLESAVADQRLQLSEKVDVVTVKSHITPAQDIYGGLTLDLNGQPWVTSGFGVVTAGGTRGITTAGHVGNAALTYAGNQLSYVYGAYGSYWDIEWYTAPGLSVTNTIQWKTDGSTRTITGTVGRDNQVIGEYVEKYGITTGLTAGHISSKTFQPYVEGGPTFAATFIRLNNTAGYSPICNFGDSGAPMFASHNAYGSLFGFPNDDTNDAIYMAINYIYSGIAVNVLTSP